MQEDCAFTRQGSHVPGMGGPKTKFPAALIFFSPSLQTHWLHKLEEKDMSKVKPCVNIFQRNIFNTGLLKLSMINITQLVTNKLMEAYYDEISDSEYT